jgi:hypothetical protein
MDINQVVAKYIELRDRKSALAKQHAEEISPISDAMQTIENWLMEQMNTLGVDSVKTAAGTPYKATQSSVKLTDAEAFKGHVFAPAVEYIHNYLASLGHHLSDADVEAIEMILQQEPRWDMVDFRAGKKGILEQFSADQSLPPGVSVDNFTVINVRRS